MVNRIGRVWYLAGVQTKPAGCVEQNVKQALLMNEPAIDLT